MRGDSTFCVVDVELALRGAGVRLDQMLDHRRRRHSLAQQAHATITPKRIWQGLRGERADAAFAMRTDRADREELACDRNPIGAALRIARNDGPGHRMSLNGTIMR